MSNKTMRLPDGGGGGGSTPPVGVVRLAEGGRGLAREAERMVNN